MNRITLLFFTLLGLITHSVSLAQNLVPNPSFELHDTCPSNNGQLSFAIPWTNPTSNKSEYFHSCYNASSGTDTVDVPSNFIGYQNAKSGNGYAGIVCIQYSPFGNNVRDYLEVKLSSALQKDTIYDVRFSVSLANSSKYAIDNIGAYLSVSEIDTNTFSYLNLIPQITNPKGETLNDTCLWHQISGIFLSHGGEEFLTIGTFCPDTSLSIDTLNGNWSLAYYYIDDVSVMKASDTLTSVLINERPIESIKVFPNPFSNSFEIEIQNQDISERKYLELYDFMGRLVKIQKLQFGITKVETSTWSSGIYLYKIVSEISPSYSTGRLLKE